MSRFLAVVLLLAGAGVASAQPNAKQVLASVDTAYANITTATLDFTQTVTYATFGNTKKSTGKMWVQRPGKLRWEYQQTRKGKTTTTKVFVTNGKTVTMIDIPNRTVDQGPMCANLTPAAMSFLTGKGTLAASFTPSVAGTTSTTIELELTPKQKSAQYKKLVLTVDSATYLVQKSVVTDTADNTNEFAFSNVNTAATIPATTFKVNLTALHNKAYSVTKHTGSCAKASAPSGGGSGSGATSGSAGTE